MTVEKLIQKLQKINSNKEIIIIDTEYKNLEIESLTENSINCIIDTKEI